MIRHRWRLKQHWQSRREWRQSLQKLFSVPWQRPQTAFLTKAQYSIFRFPSRHRPARAFVGRGNGLDQRIGIGRGARVLGAHSKATFPTGVRNRIAVGINKREFE